MSKKLWFKAKRYGWGWVPVTWGGWLTVLGFVVFQIWNAFRLDETSHSVSDTVRPFILESVVAVVVLIAICYYKGEKPSWRWGGR
jgi:uncharacterized membrane protein